jgi:hypothetical protein
MWLALAIVASALTFPPGLLKAAPADLITEESSIAASQPAQPQSGDGKRRVAVRFPPSRSTVTLPGEVKGYDVVDYVIPARARQQLTVRMTTTSRFLTMAVYRPDEKEICVETCGERWSGTITSPGDYIVRLGLARAEARRNRPARFQVRVTLTPTSN